MPSVGGSAIYGPVKENLMPLQDDVQIVSVDDHVIESPNVFKDRLPAMTASEAFDLLSKNGNLVRRPFLIDGDKVLVGFKQADWENALRSA